MRRIILTLAALVISVIAVPASADPGDIAAAARSVVRVVLVSSDGQQVNYIGHGSGVAVTPDKILTNAHVVAPMAEDNNIVIGVVPSEGAKSYGAHVIAYSPRNDLALLQLDGGAHLPPATIYTGPLDDGADVFAIGYPGNVDRAQGLDVADLVTPGPPVKTRGSISGGRSSKAFDTILHTAPIGAGNSGGPLVDACGRVIGLNSFGTVSDGGSADSEFYFAISTKEIAPFLRQANVAAATIGTACQSLAAINQSDADAARAQRDAAAQADAMRQAQRAAAYAKARQQAEYDVIGARENHLILAAILFAAAVAGGVAANSLWQRERRRSARLTAGGAAVLTLAAIAAVVTRPALSTIDTRAAAAVPPDHSAENATAPTPATGHYLCRLVPQRSRVTVSNDPTVTLDWADGGCVNGKTQYASAGGQWSRILVPNSEPTISIADFDPVARRYTVARYLLPLDIMTHARAIRGRYAAPQCTSDPTKLANLADMQTAIRDVLPAEPNELLSYDCAQVDGAAGQPVQ